MRKSIAEGRQRRVRRLERGCERVGPRVAERVAAEVERPEAKAAPRSRVFLGCIILSIAEAGFGRDENESCEVRSDPQREGGGAAR